MKIQNMFQKDIERDINGVIKVMQDDDRSLEQELSEYIITLEDLWGSADDEVLELVARRNHVTVFADDENEAPSVEDEIDFDEPKQKEPKLGFFSKLGLAFAVGSLLDKKSQSHHGHCTGDCANCPPHYGYRYGRWYYGHDHTHGCEFGGNKGGGGL